MSRRLAEAKQPRKRYNVNSGAVNPLISDEMRNKVSFLCLLTTLAVILLLTMAAVVFRDLEDYYHLLGLNQKSEVLKYLGVSMGGVLVAIQALASHKRAKAMEAAVSKQAAAVRIQAGMVEAQAEAVKQHAKANQHTEEGLRQERLKDAIGHLGHDLMSVRLGAAYELFHLASDTEGYRDTVHDILCGHIRQTTHTEEYRSQFRTEPSVEIQSILSLVFIDKHSIFSHLKADLQGSYLAGVSLRNAHLEGAKLTGSWLSEALLLGASLQGAQLGLTYLHFANLRGACLQGAILHCARLQCADLSSAQCQGVSMFGSRLQEATLERANFCGAREWTDYVAEDQHTLDTNAKEIGYSVGSRVPRFQDRLRSAVGKDSQFRTATFQGGMDQDMVDRLAASLTDMKAHMFRQRMSSHLNQIPQREPRTGIGILMGSYSDEEAEQWIYNYPKPT